MRLALVCSNPSFTGTPVQCLGRLSEKVKSYGWKGVGGWICAQESCRAMLPFQQRYRFGGLIFLATSRVCFSGILYRGNDIFRILAGEFLRKK